MKADLEVMDTLIVSLSDELNKISESHWKAGMILAKLDYQYRLLKKELENETNE